MKMKDAKLFSDREFYEKLGKLALPIALQNLMLATVAAMDALMLGSLGASGLLPIRRLWGIWEPMLRPRIRLRP